MINGMPSRLSKRCSGRPRGSIGSRRRCRWTCWLCTGCDHALSASALAWSIRSVAFWSSMG